MINECPADLSDVLRGDFAEQGGQRWKRDSWLARLGDIPGAVPVLHELPPVVDRRQAATVVGSRLADDDVVSAFIAAMVWGHGTSGYGAHRTATILTGPSATQATGAGNLAAGQVLEGVVVSLRESVQRVRQDGAVDGYRYLNNKPGRIHGLGPAFFTKWLYFASVKHDSYEGGAAPILDDLVMGWINARTDLRLRPNRTADYERYLETLTQWAGTSRTPVMVESAIFELVRSGGSTAAN